MGQPPATRRVHDRHRGTRAPRASPASPSPDLTVRELDHAGPTGPADPEAFARVQAQAEEELGPEAPGFDDDDATPPGVDDGAGGAGPPAPPSSKPGDDEGPPDVGDVELVVRTVVVGVAMAVGAGWPEVGARIRRTARAGAARFAEHFGPRLSHRGLWASLAVVASFVDLDPPAREREIEVGR
jgi:hypothetical protein